MENNVICNSCPRRCSALRNEHRGRGFCGFGLNPVAARAAAHMWEEPCISGERGSGAVFFSGCVLRCVYCQNREISRGGFGREITPERLREIYFELIEQGVHNINLVNPTHFTEAILASLEGGLPVPVVYNSGGYELPETLRRYEGKVDVWLPDMKYALSPLAARCSGAPDYFRQADAAIREMVRLAGPYEIGEDGLIRRGVIVRHLVLPEEPENTRGVIRWFAETFAPGEALFSLMSQYTPCGELEDFPNLRRRLSREEYDAALDALEEFGITDGFYQELSSAREEYIPPFDLTGI